MSLTVRAREVTKVYGVGDVAYHALRVLDPAWVEANVAVLYGFAGQFSGAVMEEGVDEGAIGIAGGGMDDHAGSFIENDDLRVLTENRKGEVLGNELGRLFLGNDDIDLVAIF